MNDLAATESLKKASGWAIAYAILIIFAGIVSLSLPLASGIGITILVGWLLVFSGIFHLADALHAHGVGPFFWRLLVGIVYVIGGFDIAFHPSFGLVTLTLVLGIMLLVQGVIGVLGFFRHRGLAGAWWILFNALITIFLGALIWWDGPRAAIWVIGTLVGVNLIFSGITRLMIFSAIRKSLSASA